MLIEQSGKSVCRIWTSRYSILCFSKTTEISQSMSETMVIFLAFLRYNNLWLHPFDSNLDGSKSQKVPSNWYSFFVDFQTHNSLKLPAWILPTKWLPRLFYERQGSYGSNSVCLQSIFLCPIDGNHHSTAAVHVLESKMILIKNEKWLGFKMFAHFPNDSSKLDSICSFWWRWRSCPGGFTKNTLLQVATEIGVVFIPC